jgi:hypothetical protein
MAETPDIRPLTPSWPSRSVVDKQGERGQPGKKKEDVDDDQNNERAEEKKESPPDKPQRPGHIDEYA